MVTDSYNNSGYEYLWQEVSAYQDKALEIEDIEVENSGFEAGVADWIVPEGYAVIPNGGRNGTPALFCERDTAEETIPTRREFRLKHNCSYRMGCWIKAEISATGEYKTGATFIMLFKKGDKVLHRIFPNGLIKSGDWTYVEKIFTMVPEADTLEIQLNIFNGYRGKAWFDGIGLEIYDKWSIYVATPGNRVIFTDCPTIKATAFCTGEKSEESLCCLAELHCREFRKKMAVKIIGRQAEITFNRLHTCGSCKAEVDLLLVDVKKKHILARENFEANIFTPEYRDKNNACWIDLTGRTIVGGISFMPIGLFMGQCSKADIDLIADSEFNCLMPYASMSLRFDYKYDGEGINHYTDFYDGDDKNSIAKINEVLDYCNEKKLKIIFSLMNLYQGKKLNISKWQGVEGTENIVEKAVNSFKDNPALLAWYVNDESPVSMLDVLYKRRQLVNRLDPFHPAWCVSMHFTELYAFTNTCDMMGIDPYPLINNDSDLSSLEFAGQQAEKLKMPYWGVGQIFSWAYYEPLEVMRQGETWDKFPIPSEEDIRTMMLSMALDGAKGFLFYYFPCIRDYENFIPIKDYFRDNWEKVKNVASALKSIESYLLSDLAPQTVNLTEVKGSVRATRFINNEGHGCIIITAGKQEKSACVINCNGNYKSRFGNTRFIEKGKYLFEGNKISSDILFEQ